MQEQRSLPPIARADRINVPWWLRALWRYFGSGKELIGCGDNATWCHAASMDYRARPYVKLTGPRWQRVARRHVGGWTALLAGYAWLAGSAVAWSVVGVEGGALGTWGCVLLWEYAQNRVINRKYVDPAAEVLCREVGMRYHKRNARKLIQLPAGYGRATEDGAEPLPVRVTIPVNKAIPASARKKLVDAIAGRLGIPDATGEWFEANEHVTVDLRGCPVPPKTVTYADARAAMLAAEAHAPLAGVSAGKKNVHLDFRQDSPHIAWSGPSGTGKSVYVRCLLMQRMRHGNGVMVLDPKRWSHKWLHNLPSERVQYLWKIEDIHEGLCAVADEQARRIACDESELGTFRDVDIIVEELNTLIRRLSKHWKMLRADMMRTAKLMEKDDPGSADPAMLNPPAQSPAIAALQDGVGMGRELQMHWWVMAQRLSANIFGANGGDIRESFQLRNMAKWDRKLWKMLADGVRFVPWPSGPRGVWGCVVGDEFSIFRVPWVTEEQARAYALSGGPVDGPVLGARSGRPSLDSEWTEQGELSSAVRLSAALDSPSWPAGQDGITLDGLRKAAQRPGFPAPRGLDGQARLYALDELIEWELRRQGRVE